MTERQKEHFSPPAMGGSSLLTVFAVLALTVFALLSLATVRADVRLADASARATADYYAADCKAQEILAQLRNGEVPEIADCSLFKLSQIQGANSGEPGEGTELSGGGLLYANYSVPISDSQELQVSVILQGVSNQDYVILRWRAVSVGGWTPDEGLDLWDGDIF